MKFNKSITNLLEAFDYIKHGKRSDINYRYKETPWTRYYEIDLKNGYELKIETTPKTLGGIVQFPEVADYYIKQGLTKDTKAILVSYMINVKDSNEEGYGYGIKKRATKLLGKEVFKIINMVTQVINEKIKKDPNIRLIYFTAETEFHKKLYDILFNYILKHKGISVTSGKKFITEYETVYTFLT